MSNILQGLNKTQVHDGAFLLTESRTYKLWESAGQKIVEAQLTADQINQIFQQVEQGATAGGGNRTMLGKGKDAAGAVKKAYDDLVSKVQNSGPIKGVDAMYDNAAEKLKQATGGDQGVMKYVQKYRDFAKEHPVAQGLIYSALIAAAGISGAGIGGAAALGLFKMVDKLLQGEKFSTAVGKGVTTGAMAYGASKVGDLFKGSPQGATPNASGSPELDDFHSAAQKADGAALAASGNATNPDGTASDAMKRYMDLDSAQRTAYDKIPTSSSSSVSGTLSGVTGEQMASHPAYQAMIQKFGNTPGARQAAMSAAKAAILRGQANESIDLTESQIFLMIGKIVERQRKIDEGIMDTVKGAAGKAVDWAKTKGTNLTTKVTADKLLQAWKKAGSPTDSLDVASIIQKSGVPSDSIKQVYTTMQIPFAGEKGAGASTKRNIDVDPSSVAPGAPTSAPSASAPPATANAPAQAAQAAPAATGSLAQAQELIAKLDPETKTKLISTLKQELSVAESRINELSNEKLGQYKKAASADATAADKAGDYKRGDKRFSGIVKATKKQFANDEKKSVAEAGNNYHDNRTGFTRPKRDLSGEGEPQGMFMVMIDGRPWKEFTSNVAFARAKTLADKNPTKKIQVRWPTGQLNTVTEDELDENCWKGYHKEGNKELFGKTVPNCVKNEGVAEGESGMFSKVMGHETTPEAARQIQQQGFKKSHTGIFFNVGNQNYSGGGYGGTVVMAKVSGPIDDILNLEDDNDLPDNLDDFADGEEIANYAREEGYWAWTDGVQFAVLDPRHIQVVKQGVAEGGYPEVDHMPGPTIKRTQTGCKRCHGKGYVYKTPDGEVHPINRPDAKKYKCGKCDGIGFVKVAEQGVAEGSEEGSYSDKFVQSQIDYYTKHVLSGTAADRERINGSLNYYQHIKNKRIKDGTWQEQGVAEEQHSCPHCGGELVSEELMNEKKDACYYKVKSRYKVWPSAYASGALVKCRNKGASNWGNGGKKNESSILEGINQTDESLHDWFNKEKWVRMDTKGKIKGPCAREPGEGKPKCLPQAKAHSLGKKGRAGAAARKRREDPNPERSGKAINVNTKKKSNENIDEDWKKKLGAAALTGAMALGAAGANARVMPGDDPNINRLTGKPIATQQATDTAPAKAEAPKGFSKEYLQKAADPNRFGRFMISVEKAQELLKQGQ